MKNDMEMPITALRRWTRVILKAMFGDCCVKEQRVIEKTARVERLCAIYKYNKIRHSYPRISFLAIDLGRDKERLGRRTGKALLYLEGERSEILMERDAISLRNSYIQWSLEIHRG